MAKVGYIIASKLVSEGRKEVGYLYREEPTDEMDSGWRVFSGEEDQEFADDADNFAIYNASTIVEIDPSIADLLLSPPGAAFERDSTTGQFGAVTI